MTDLLTQEVIERLRDMKRRYAMLRQEPTPCSTADLGTILAVLEAAREWAVAMNAWAEATNGTAYPEDGDQIYDRYAEAHRALLALISVELPE